MILPLTLGFMFLIYISQFLLMFIFMFFDFLIHSAQEWRSCSVGCHFGVDDGKKPDAAFGLPQQTGTASVLRSMESSQYYAENNIAQARRWVSTI